MNPIKLGAGHGMNSSERSTSPSSWLRSHSRHEGGQMRLPRQSHTHTFPLPFPLFLSYPHLFTTVTSQKYTITSSEKAASAPPTIHPPAYTETPVSTEKEDRHLTRDVVLSRSQLVYCIENSSPRPPTPRQCLCRHNE